MKKAYGIVLAAIIAAATLISAMAAPGDSGDPLVSKSYVDDKFNQLLTVLSAASDAAASDAPPVMPDGGGQAAEAAPAPAYVPVSVGAGRLLIGGEGTEIILRSGRAAGYCTGINGLVDATDGGEVINGTEIAVNHLLIVPRGDGRGAAVLDDAWFLVKGDYSIL